MIEALQYEFMRNALLTGVLAALACGMVGVFVIIKKMVSISGSIAHASFGGIGLGYFLGTNPIVGALFFSMASALVMGWVIRKTKLPVDTAIGILWAIGMAFGIIFIGLTPGYAPDLMVYLFGNILTVPFSDVLIIAALDVIILLVVVLLYRELLLMSFDEEFGMTVGLKVTPVFLLLLGLVSLTVVILIRVVGMILVIALLTFPATMARQFTFNTRRMMALATLFGVVFVIAGLWLSFALDVASGATIILVSGFTLLIVLGVKKLYRICRAR